MTSSWSQASPSSSEQAKARRARRASGNGAGQPEVTPDARLCIAILSVKSSGSSIVQRELARALSARLLNVTDHAENETLFWTKAASVLHLRQFKLANSEIPMGRRRAARMLRQFLEANIPGFAGGLATEAELFSAWAQLVHSGEGVLVEKSPHHLYQPAVVALMRRFAEQAKSVDMRFVGLVRNPVDTLYSSWRRFGVRPEIEERHWIRAYTTLGDFHAERPDLVTIVRYEDLAAGSVDLPTLLGLDSASRTNPDGEAFHRRSIQKWRQDEKFGYRPGPELIRLAQTYGYDPAEIANPNAGRWWPTWLPRATAWYLFSRLPFQTQVRIKAAAKRLLRS
jgi:hypothetical protein